MTATTKTKHSVIVIRESLSTSIASDCFTFAMLIAMVGVGILLDSGTLQWIGGIMALITMATRASGKDDRLTIEQARAKLDELEARP